MGKYYNSAEEIYAADKAYNMHSWSTQGAISPKVIEKAEGIFFWDSTGKKYYDMSSQLVNLNIGYGNKKVIEAMKEQAEKMPYIGPGFAMEERSALAQKIIEVAPDNMAKVFFTLGGADANENAIKIAKQYTGRNKVFSRYRSYHGSTYGAGNLTGEPRRYPMEPGIPGFVKFMDPYLYRCSLPFASEEAATKYYVDQLREQIIYEGRDKVACLVMETVTGSNGIIIPPTGYMEGVRAICDEFGIIMICDEVMAGFGRTGKWFAVENFNVKPDLITFAKGVTSGYVPLGGVIVCDKVAKFFDTNFLSCGLTYQAHPMGMAAGCASIEFFKESNLLGHVEEMGKLLGTLLEEVKTRHESVGDVRYIGLFSCVELVKDKETKEPLVPYGIDPEGLMKKVVGMLIAKGFFTYTHENYVFVCPPLIIVEKELREAIAILDEVLFDVDKMIK